MGKSWDKGAAREAGRLAARIAREEGLPYEQTRNAYHKAYRKIQRDTASPDLQVHYVRQNRKHKLRISHEAFEAKLKAQHHRCAICECPVSLRSCADHDHQTGRFRGVLCNECNRGLGQFKDSGALIDKAKQYLTLNS